MHDSTSRTRDKSGYGNHHKIVSSNSFLNYDTNMRGPCTHIVAAVAAARAAAVLGAARAHLAVPIVALLLLLCDVPAGAPAVVQGAAQALWQAGRGVQPFAPPFTSVVLVATHYGRQQPTVEGTLLGLPASTIRPERIDQVARGRA